MRISLNQNRIPFLAVGSRQGVHSFVRSCESLVYLPVDHDIHLWAMMEHYGLRHLLWTMVNYDKEKCLGSMHAWATSSWALACGLPSTSLGFPRASVYCRLGSTMVGLFLGQIKIFFSNNLYLDLIFGIHLIMRALEGFHPHPWDKCLLLINRQTWESS